MYEIIYTDPPWPQKKGNVRKARPNQGRALDYKTMCLDDIRDYHSDFLLANAADSHNVFMWAIDKYLHDAEKMMADLGYTLHARIVWDKENGVAPAFTLRFAHEYLLWFYPKGKMLKPAENMRGKYTTVIRERAAMHSKKPQAAYEMFERMFPAASKAELFARKLRSGWDSFGDELEDEIWTPSNCQ
jgi:N6-adenosine-specific RNA methylase IME4